MMQASILACIICVYFSEKGSAEVHFQMPRYLAKAAAILALPVVSGTDRFSSLSNPTLRVREPF